MREGGSAFFEVGQIGQDCRRNVLRCGRHFVEVGLQALVNEPEPVGFDLRDRPVLIGMRQTLNLSEPERWGGTAPVAV
jgi:hypothetical protein